MVRDVGRDAAEHPADALHAPVADHDQVGAEALRLLDQRVGRLALDRAALDVRGDPGQHAGDLAGDRLGGLAGGQVPHVAQAAGLVLRGHPLRIDGGEDVQGGTGAGGQLGRDLRGLESARAAVDADEDDVGHVGLL